MNEDALAIVTSQLRDAEKVLWAGRPRQGVRFSVLDVIVVPFTLFWSWGVANWEVAVIRQGAPLPAVLFGLPFVMLGLHILAGRFFLDAARRRRTFYGLTDQRALIISVRSTPNVKSLPLQTLTGLKLFDKTDRSGTLVFDPAPSARLLIANLTGLAFGDSASRRPPAFEMIENARDVYDQIERLRRLAWRLSATMPP